MRAPFLLAVSLAAGQALAQTPDAFTNVSAGPAGASLNDAVIDSAVGPDGSIFVAGWFTEAGGQPAGGVARWDGAAWRAVGGGLSGDQPYALALARGLNGDVYVGGEFSAAGGVSASRIARWDGSSWHPLGSGMDGQVRALTVGPDGTVFASGNFQTAGGMAVSGMARWNGVVWSALPQPPQGGTHAISVGPNGEIFALGYEFGPSAALPQVFRFDGVGWESLGTWASSATLSALTIGPDGMVYVGGLFADAAGVPARNLARWDGASWHPLASGADGRVHALALTPDGRVYIGGRFTTAGGIASPFITLYNPVEPVASAPQYAGGTIHLRPAAPNPNRGAARVAFSLAEAGWARVTVVDVLGREVAVLHAGATEAGAHETVTAGLPAGTYLVVLDAGGQRLTQPMTVVR